MKLLLVHNSYQKYGGEQAVVDAQIALFEKKGHHVVTYTRNNHETEIYNFRKKVNFFPEAIYSNRTIKEIQTLVNHFSPDVALVHNVFPLISPSIYSVLHQNQIPVIQFIHNFRFMCPNGFFYTRGHLCELCKMGNTAFAIRYRCYRNSAVLSALYALSIGVFRKSGALSNIGSFIALNPFSKNRLIESGIASENHITVIPNFLRNPLPEPNFYRNSLEFISIGRISEEKGLQVIIRALPLLPRVKLRILGTGPYEENLRRIIDQKDLSERIIFHGQISGEEKYSLFRNSAGFLLPSLWYEQFPMTILEGMATGTPIIASNIGGLRYIIHDRVNGLLFTTGDEKDLAQKMQWLLENSAKAHEFGVKGREQVEDQYSEDSYYKQLLDLFAKVIA